VRQLSRHPLGGCNNNMKIRSLLIVILGFILFEQSNAQYYGVDICARKNELSVPALYGIDMGRASIEFSCLQFPVLLNDPYNKNATSVSLSGIVSTLGVITFDRIYHDTSESLFGEALGDNIFLFACSLFLLPNSQIHFPMKNNHYHQEDDVSLFFSLQTDYYKGGREWIRMSPSFGMRYPITLSGNLFNRSPLLVIKLGFEKPIDIVDQTLIYQDYGILVSLGLEIR
jgi:hypothetical protein